MRLFQRLAPLLVLGAAALCVASTAAAEPRPVGERHLETANPTAVLRDAEHRPLVRITVWYPAAEGAVERSLDLGPAGQPLFYVGSAAPDAPFADARRRPVILFSHGFGGTARMMAWFTTVMAQQGYIVIAVDHPGNNGLDKMTIAGGTMFWDRPGDLAAALETVKADPAIGPHLDIKRLGVAGFSAGGFTALAAAGARVDMKHFTDFCAAHPDDGVCKPQLEFPVTIDKAMEALKEPDLAAEVKHVGDDHSIRGVRAAFAIAPAIVQAFDPASLTAMNTPVAIILGDADPIAPPHTNGGVAARAIPRAQLKALPGVGHYDFLSTCSPMARQAVPMCKNIAVPQGQSHFEALQMALNFFGATLGPP
jgi:predicted dienelactone hydrolase